ncbi:MAG TPA: CPBP family intramembrane glutamic endopeptidase [Terriglobales bacterium]|nr:CPBP family intramembrane glutamic endopeptidase [Terriglobales bacterium]
MQAWNSTAILALVWALVPLFAFGFAGTQVVRCCEKLAPLWRLLLPAVFGMPYLLVAGRSAHRDWLVLYLGLPILIAALLWSARRADPQQLGNWRDFAILLLLGLTVDMRWFEPAWPASLRVINKLILLDSGLYGFLVIRQLENVGLDLRIRREDLRIGLRELIFYAPIVVPLGLWLGFLHFRPHIPQLGTAIETWLITFFAIAVPEEIYFRGWIQNLIERRIGRQLSLTITAVIFGLAHFNRKSTVFNWRYVLLAAIAGIFYGRAWRKSHRVAASAITHSCVDAIWSLWL